jgi:hypothetical protein
MPPQDKVQGPNDIWTPEPELRDMPPRRVGPSEYPDLNRPNGAVVLGVGAVLLAVGLGLFVTGMAGKGALFTILGLVLAIAGTGLLVYFPTKIRAHTSRAEHLVSNGMPVIARIVSADNLTGDSTYGRAVKYQVALPGGEMVHRTVNADDRTLPRRIPGDSTALVDMQSGDVELYCALPFRAIPKGAPVTSVPHAAPAAAYVPPSPAPATTTAAAATPTPAATPGAMGTLGTVAPPPRSAPPVEPAPPAPAPPTAEPEPAPSPSQEQKQQQTQKTGTTSGLPWE